MNQITIRFLAPFLFAFLPVSVIGQDGSFRVVLHGEVVDRPYSNTLMLMKEDDDPRVSGVSIPIENGKFQHELEADHAESYVLVFLMNWKGSIPAGCVFAEPDTLRFTLYPRDRFADNELSGGTLNQAFVAFDRNIEERFGLHSLGNKQTQLFAENRFLTPEAAAMQNAIRQAENEEIRDSLQYSFQAMERAQKHLTPEALEITRRFREQFIAWMDWKTVQVIDEPSLVTYRELLSLLRMAKSPHSDPIPIALPDLLASYEKHYRGLYPSHPYTETVETYLESMVRIKAGGTYIDFTAPDFEGNPVTLSERIAGKVAVINLWASWCGPCRRKGLELIPVYEEYKDRGFEVVGVAREKEETTGIQAAQKDGYPWVNLLEIKDSQGIWKKYGLDNSGGGVFLVDEDGLILAVSPTTEEVRTILAQRL